MKQVIVECGDLVGENFDGFDVGAVIDPDAWRGKDFADPVHRLAVDEAGEELQVFFALILDGFVSLLGVDACFFGVEVDLGLLLPGEVIDLAEAVPPAESDLVGVVGNEFVFLREELVCIDH